MKKRGGNNNKSPAEHELIKRLYIVGATGRQIAAITGFGHNTIVRHILMFREYIKCVHGIKSYKCGVCRTCNRHRRKPLEYLRQAVGLADDRI